MRFSASPLPEDQATVVRRSAYSTKTNSPCSRAPLLSLLASRCVVAFERLVVEGIFLLLPPIAAVDEDLGRFEVPAPFRPRPLMIKLTDASIPKLAEYFLLSSKVSGFLPSSRVLPPPLVSLALFPSGGSAE